MVLQQYIKLLLASLLKVSGYVLELFPGTFNERLATVCDGS